MKILLMLANIEFYLHQPYLVIDRDYNIIKRFDSLNAEDQCKNYAQWYGRKTICIKK